MFSDYPFLYNESVSKSREIGMYTVLSKSIQYSLRGKQKKAPFVQFRVAPQETLQYNILKRQQDSTEMLGNTVGCQLLYLTNAWNCSIIRVD